MSPAPTVPVTPRVLHWAIDTSGMSHTEVAKRAKVNVVSLEDWLAGRGRPNFHEFKRLAGALRRPSATFLLSKPPDDPGLLVEFRHPPGYASRKLNRKEALKLRETARLQQGLGWVVSQLGVEAAKLPTFDLASDAETAARKVRKMLNVGVDDQRKWSNESQALRAWRDAVENLGLSVFLVSMGEESSRGFSLWQDVNPAITINTHWNPQARIFTIFHELGHLVTRTNSMCVEGANYQANPHGDEVERWCERFAAAVLLPWSDVSSFLMEKTGWSPGKQIEDLPIASKVARAFRVSLRAAVIRLVENGAAGWALYRKIPKMIDAKGGGGGSGRVRAQIRLDEYGRRTAALMLRGVDEDVLTRDDANSYLNVRDADLDELRTLTMEP